MILEDKTKDTQSAEVKADETANDNAGAEKDVKTFTQEELDSIVNERLAREKKKMPSKEDMALFKTWQAENKAKEDVKTPSAEDVQIKNELSQAKAELELFKAGIKTEYLEFVGFKISSMDSDDELSEKVATFKKNNPQYFADLSVQKKGSANPRMTGGSKPQSSNQKMNDLIRGIKK